MGISKPRACFWGQPLAHTVWECKDREGTQSCFPLTCPPQFWQFGGHETRVLHPYHHVLPITLLNCFLIHWHFAHWQTQASVYGWMLAVLYFKQLSLGISSFYTSEKQFWEDGIEADQITVSRGLQITEAFRSYQKTCPLFCVYLDTKSYTPTHVLF